MNTYSTLKDAATAAFAKLKPTQRLFDGVDYWTLEDLMIEAGAREASDEYNVDAKGNIFIPGIEAPVYAVSTQADADWKNHIACLRHAAGLTQRQAADAAGINISQVQRLEAGTSKAENLSLKNAIALATAYGVEPAELME